MASAVMRGPSKGILPVALYIRPPQISDDLATLYACGQDLARKENTPLPYSIRLSADVLLY